MNHPSTQVFGFPIKGVNKTFARSKQPQETAYDMLNVLPYDRSGRLRGGKRSGTVKLWADPIGDDTDSVLLLDQVTLVTPATSETPAVTAFSDTFTYSDGELNAVSGGVWVQFDEGTGSTATYVQVASNVAVMPASGSFRGAILRPAFTPTDIDLAAGYSWEGTITLGAGAGSSGNEFSINLETDDTAWFLGNFTFFAIVNLSAGPTVIIEYGTPATTIGPNVVTGVAVDVPFQLRVDVSAGTGSRTATVFINGVSQGSIAIGTAASAASQNFLMVANVDVGASNYVKMDTVTYTNPGVASSGLATRTTKIIAVANRDVFIGTITAEGVLATGGSNVIKKSVFPEGCYSAGKYFIVDGLNITQVDMATEAVETYGTGGTIVGTPPIGTVCCIWRDRLMIAGPDQNFYGSRVGDHFDWDYSQEDVGAAFVGNDSVAGHIGEPIVALIPLSDDVLAIGGDHDLHVFSGDPAAGGSIDLVSEAVGILGPRSWCKSPEGTVYFLGTGGLYRWDSPEAKPVNIADMKWSQVFSDIDRSRTFATMVWNRDKQGMMIYLYKTGHTITDAPLHLWYDRRLDALFPVKLPVGHGPTSVLVYDGDLPDDRVTILGGRDGYVRAESDTATSDDGDAIDAFLKFGPFPIGDPNNDGIISRIQITAGEPPTGFTTSDLNMDVSVRAGLTAYDVTDRGDDTKLRVAARSYPGQQGHLSPMRQRVKGAYGMIEISDNSDDKIFAFEQMTVDMVLAGFTRH